MAYPVVGNDALTALWAVTGPARETGGETARTSYAGPPPSDGMDHAAGGTPQGLDRFFVRVQSERPAPPHTPIVAAAAPPPLPETLTHVQQSQLAGASPPIDVVPAALSAAVAPEPSPGTLADGTVLASLTPEGHATRAQVAARRAAGEATDLPRLAQNPGEQAARVPGPPAQTSALNAAMPPPSAPPQSGPPGAPPALLGQPPPQQAAAQAGQQNPINPNPPPPPAQYQLREQKRRRRWRRKLPTDEDAQATTRREEAGQGEGEQPEGR